MAQINFTPISLYYSTTASVAPAASSLLNGELAINITDGKLFYKDNLASIQIIGYKVTPANAGGTGFTSYTDGQLLIGNSTGNTLAKSTLTAGTGISVSNGAGSITISALVSAPVTKTANFTVAVNDVWLINNKSGSACVVTLPNPALSTGRVLYFKNYQAQPLTSASSNVVGTDGGAAGTSILLASLGDMITLVADGTNWVTMQYMPNNVLLVE